MHDNRGDIARRVARVAATAAAVASFALLAVIGLAPRTGRLQVFTVLSGSMSPSIPAGSAVLVTPVEPESLRVGDVITYRIPVQDRRVVTHRIVDIDEAEGRPTIRTQGDATEDPDQWTTRFGDGRVWKVRVHVAGAGYGLRAVQTPGARKLALWVVPAMLAAAWLVEIWGTAGTARRGPLPVNPTCRDRTVIVVGPPRRLGRLRARRTPTGEQP